jgi:hypothetical protein
VEEFGRQNTVEISRQARHASSRYPNPRNEKDRQRYLTTR